MHSEGNTVNVAEAAWHISALAYISIRWLMKRHMVYLAVLLMADYDEMLSSEVTATCWHSIKVAEEEKAAEFQRVFILPVLSS